MMFHTKNSTYSVRDGAVYRLPRLMKGEQKSAVFPAKPVGKINMLSRAVEGEEFIFTGLRGDVMRTTPVLEIVPKGEA